MVQAFPSVHGAVLFEWTHPVAGTHESSVQTLPSLQFGAGPGIQLPPAQVSPTVHALPSLHGSVLFAWTQPDAGLHESVVQTLLSLQFGAAPGVHAPAVQVSPTVQALPSLHETAFRF